MRALDLTNKQFGKLLVIKCLCSRQEGKRKYRWWLCRCDCGNFTEVRASHLVSKNGTRSCGCLNPYHPLSEGEASFNQIFDRYKRQAKQRGLQFKLSKEEFRNLITSNCHYCNSAPNSVQESHSSNGGFVYSGVDRIDSSKGYFLDNCVPCCKTCNFMKRNMATQKFIEQCKKIVSAVE